MSEVAQNVFKDMVLAGIPTIGVAGPPKAGKTTLVKYAEDLLYHTILHTDDYMKRGISWDEIPEAITKDITEIRAKSSFEAIIVEGVQVPRIIRHVNVGYYTYFIQFDAIIWLNTPKVPLTSDQEGMAKGCRTIMNDVLDRNMVPQIVWCE